MTWARSYFFVRHGEAIYQARSFRAADYVRGTEWPLTARGVEQARAIARSLATVGCERVVSSRLLRARQTAEAIAESALLPYADEWSELDEIMPRGLRITPPARRWPEAVEGMLGMLEMRRQLRGQPHTSHDLREVRAKIATVLARLDQLREPRVAVIGHGYWILLMSLALPGPMRVRPITNCSITRVDSNGRGEHRLVSFAWRP